MCISPMLSFLFFWISCLNTHSHLTSLLIVIIIFHFSLSELSFCLCVVDGGRGEVGGQVGGVGGERFTI